MLGLREVTLEPPFTPTGPVSRSVKASVCLPRSVAALDTVMGNFFAQAFVEGASAYYCNGVMSASFLSEKEAEAIESLSRASCSGDDAGSVLRHLVAPRDRALILRSVSDLLVRHSTWAAHTTVDVHVQGRSGQVLCHADLSVDCSPDGGLVVIGVKLTPHPDRSSTGAKSTSFLKYRELNPEEEKTKAFSDHLRRARGEAPVRPVIRRIKPKSEYPYLSPQRGGHIKISSVSCATPVSCDCTCTGFCLNTHKIFLSQNILFIRIHRVRTARPPDTWCRQTVFALYAPGMQPRLHKNWCVCVFQ